MNYQRKKIFYQCLLADDFSVGRNDSFHWSIVSSVTIIYTTSMKEYHEHSRYLHYLGERLLYLLELRTKLNWRVSWICSGRIAGDKAINQGVKIRLWEQKELSNRLIMVLNQPNIWDAFRNTCTSNKSDVAFTGRNLERGTLIPIALSKN